MQTHLIGDAWIPGDRSFETRNPSDLEDVVARYAEGDATTVDAAVGAARAVSARWAATTPQERFTVLDAVGTELLARREELGRLLSREEGKTLPEGIGEVTRAGQIFKFFAGEALRLGGEKLDSVRPGVEVDLVRHPLGVVGAIAPWNFPMAIPAWKTAPALAYGNTVVLKPSEKAPGCAWALAEILSRSGLPEGAFNLVLGAGEAGRALAEHPGLDGLSFTGSQAVGRKVAASCAARGVKVQVEMGGKNPLVVLDDADLDKAVETAVQGAFFSTGQRCTASSRLIVTEGIHDRFVETLVARTRGLKVGHALETGIEIGPVIDQLQLDKNFGYIDIAKGEGAVLACGGETVARATRGHFMSPALFVDTTNTMRINREEVFGPVATVLRARDFEEALALANDTEFGLSAGICTTSLKHARAFQRRAQAGMVMVNLPTAGVDYHVPFGGTKGSSYGSREQGTYARDFYTWVKTCYVAG